jgi:hypothetical protein
MDELFLLKPNFIDNMIDQEEKRYYCPSCAAIEGVLAYYPKLRELVEIVYVDFQKPRKAIVDSIGEDNQSCPVLVMDKNRSIADAAIQSYNDKQFINSSDHIMKYLAETYKVGYPHP